MTNTEMEKAIRAMAEHLADQVVKLISSCTLKELAAFSADRKNGPPRALREEQDEGKPANKTKKKPGHSAKRASGKSAKSAKKGHRTTHAEVSASVLEILKKAKDPMKAAAILDQLDPKPTHELLGRVLRDLIARGLVAKRGATRATQYQITMSGLET